MCEAPLESHQDGQYWGSRISPSSTHLTSRSSRTFSGRSRMARSGRTKSSTLPSCRYCRHRRGISEWMLPHPFLGLPPRVKHGHRAMPLGCRSFPGTSPGWQCCPACALPLLPTREQWRSTAVTSSGLRRRAAVSWMCGSRASGSLPLGCRVAMPMGPRMLARRLFSGEAQQGGVASGARTAPASPESSPCPQPSSSLHTRAGQTRAARGQAHAEPALPTPPGTRALLLPRFRLRMTNFCTAPTAREMESGECPGQTAASPSIVKTACLGNPSLCPFHARDAQQAHRRGNSPRSSPSLPCHPG